MLENQANTCPWDGVKTNSPMGLVGKFFGFLRAISLVWCFSSVVRALLAMGKSDTFGLRIHLVLLIAGGIVFALATFARNRWGAHGARSIVASTKASWWRASFAFRTCAFISVAWATAAYLWQDDYGREYTLVFGPPLGLLVAYGLFNLVVVGPAKSASATTELQPRPNPTASVQSSVLEEQSEGSTPAERERLMRELVQRIAQKQ
jgi:hypothetical protein